MPQSQWREQVGSLALLRGLSADELARLQRLVWLFLAEKAVVGVQGLELSDGMRLRIAAQACLPVLELGLGSYRNLEVVLVYPGEFVARHEYEDEAGVVHQEAVGLSGEAWVQGPVILSWEDVAGEPQAGINLVIHEFAHKLDMLSGAANGLPPLHADMSVAQWGADFSAAYSDMARRVELGEATVLDAYAVEDPAEFFAVMTEAFFAAPGLLLRSYPGVYGQLRHFYRQDPALRQGC
ncbi:zinc-dependent peptidase [Marinobacterium rhizophilum]|uniref:M90 family metallopeptidase n=1 Tax=Marinobacterium rhizophilum TaxID=420402 RepID=UPI00210321FE|nr:M90 family metallopeptidase [Marinobacterium rhizophilum]